MKHKPIEEQVIVVFGASSGIGRATALTALERGATVVAAGRDREALDSLAAEGPAGRVVVSVADAADPAQVAAVADAAVAERGRIDTWAHVAGIGAYGRFEDMAPDELRRVIEVDLLGPMWGARAALPHLRRGGGAYVVVSSELAKRSFPLASAYSAAKHGVNGFVEALRLEVERDDDGVTVTQIMPEAVATPFFDHARTRLGVRPAGPPPITSAETVAHKILHAAEHGGRDVPVGAGARAQLALQRVSPRVMDAFSRATAFRLQRSDEPKPAGDDALSAAPSGDARTEGIAARSGAR
jgi:NAD(P)-dependent dehydrogenase (short-subunit alcohol dehydrogenase family)